MRRGKSSHGVLLLSGSQDGTALHAAPTGAGVWGVAENPAHRWRELVPGGIEVVEARGEISVVHRERREAELHCKAQSLYNQEPGTLRKKRIEVHE
jgi:hypothetical protein